MALADINIPSNGLLPYPDYIFCFDVETGFTKEVNIRKMPMINYVHSAEARLLTMVGVGVPFKADRSIDMENRFSIAKKGRLVQRPKVPTKQILNCADQIKDGFKKNIRPGSVVWLVGHNLGFDAAVLERNFRITKAVRCVYMDTLSMAQYLWHEKGTTGKQHGLGLSALGESIFGIPKMEDFELLPDMSEWDTDYIDELFKYNIVDTQITWKLFQYLLPKIPVKHLFTIHWTVKQFVEPALYTDINEVEEFERLCIQERDDTIAEVPGATLKILSSAKQCEELFGKHGVGVPHKVTPKGNRIPQLAISDDFMLRNKNDKGMCGKIVRARIAAKSTQNVTRSKTLKQAASVDGKYRFHIMASGTFTHRPAGRSGGGGNPLNLTRKSPLRKSIAAPKGKLLLAFDYSKMELCIARHGALDKQAMHKLKTGIDLYSSFVCGVMNMDYDKFMHLHNTLDHADEKWIELDGIRFVGKTSQLSLQYGVGADAFFNAVKASGKYPDMTLEEAQKIVSYFRYKAHPRIPEAWNQCGRMLTADYAKRLAYFKSSEWDLCFPGVPVKEGWRWNGSGRVIRYPELRTINNLTFVQSEVVYSPMYPLSRASRKIHHSAYFQALCQSCANEVTDDCRAQLIREGCNVVSECYDELLLIIDPNDEAATRELVAKTASTVHLDWWEVNPPTLKVDIGVGENYYEAKP